MATTSRLVQIDENSLASRYEELEAWTKKEVGYGETAGLRQRHRRRQIDPLEMLEKTYAPASVDRSLVVERQSLEEGILRCQPLAQLVQPADDGVRLRPIMYRAIGVDLQRAIGFAGPRHQPGLITFRNPDESGENSSVGGAARCFNLGKPVYRRFRSSSEKRGPHLLLQFDTSNCPGL